MTPYPAYKPTNIDWIGEIPEHWNLTKVKFISTIYGRIGYRGYTVEDIVDEGSGAVTISPSNIKNDAFTLESFTSISWEKYFESPEIMVFENDIILVKTGSTIGKTAIIPSDCPKMTINPQLIVLKNIKINSKFLYYQTTCNFFKDSFFIEQTGSTTPTISQEKVNLFPILEIPNLFEQQALVTYLDQKTALIDELIAKKERKIELLKENRTAIINHAVTRGLDPKVKLKPSGIEWIGEIPVGWMKSKVKWELVFHNNTRVPIEAEIRGNLQGEYPYYGASGIIDYVNDFIFNGEFILVGEDGPIF
jgi:type I restriction enzyme, S subunit